MGDQAFCAGGGGYPSLPCVTTHRMYDLSENSWTNKTSKTYSLKSGWDSKESGVSGYIDGYIFGGSTGCGSQLKCEQYDISANSWSVKTDQPFNDGGHHRPCIGAIVCCNDIRYDIPNNAWLAGGLRHGSNAAAFGIGGYYYAMSGGADQQPGPGKKLDASTLAYGSISQMPVGRWESCGIEDGTYGYVIQGASDRGAANMCWTNTNYRYDPSSDTWATRASAGANSKDNATFLINGSPHTIGGQAAACNGYGTTNYHGRYDNAGNSWTSKASHPVSGAGQQGFNAFANLPPSTPTGLGAVAT